MKTKAISLILVLAMLITIGGVYAAWMYAEKDLTAVHGHLGSFGLSNAVLNISKGTVTVDASQAHLTIDQTDTADYTAKLVATGTITITFEPSETFMNTYGEDTYEMYFGLKTDNTNPTNYLIPDPDDNNNLKPLFTKFDVSVPTTAKVQLTKKSSGTTYVYEGTLDASVLTDRITLNTFVLDSYADYEAFSKKVGAFGNIGIEVSEIG